MKRLVAIIRSLVAALLSGQEAVFAATPRKERGAINGRCVTLRQSFVIQAIALGAKLQSALRRLSIDPVIPIPTIIIAQLAGSGTAVVT